MTRERGLPSWLKSRRAVMRNPRRRGSVRPAVPVQPDPSPFPPEPQPDPFPPPNPTPDPPLPDPTPPPVKPPIPQLERASLAGPIGTRAATPLSDAVGPVRPLPADPLRASRRSASDCRRC